FSSRRRHTRFSRDWSSDVCSSDLFTLQQNDHSSVEPSANTSTSLIPDLVSQLVESMRLQITPEHSQVRIALRPEELGHVEVRIRSEERRVGKVCGRQGMWAT